MTPMRVLLVAGLVLGLSGCTITPTETLDSVETSVRDARVNYQERMDRVALEWICTGMSWPKLVELTGGDMALLNTVMESCQQRIFPITETTP